MHALPIVSAASSALTEGAGFTLTADMLKGLTDSISANAAVLVPVGVTVLSILAGIGVIPRILHKFGI